MIEQLETRRLFAVTAVQSGAFLTINGNNANDNITAVENGGNVAVVYTDGSGVFHDGVNNHADPKAYFTGIAAVKINGGGGGDSIYYTGNSVGGDIHGDNVGSGTGADNITLSDEGIAGSTVRGDAGNDTITVLHSHDSFAYGGDGNDQFYLNERDVSETVNVYGEGGKDTVVTYGGTNFMDGGEGKDKLIDMGGANSSVGFEVFA